MFMFSLSRQCVRTGRSSSTLAIRRFNSSGPFAASGTTMTVKQRFENITKSEEDKSLYRGLILDNGMRVLLVSDESTDKSAACMDVAVGFMSDPKDLPGLAHFCEHMLFLGTEKYPAENQYSKFISEHSGRSNAHTAADHTDYYFDIAPEHLRSALDIFAQFFISPLFTESATDREVNAIESENSKNILNDVWRLSQLEKSLSREGHPFRTFGTGNRQTLIDQPKELGINVRDELLKFHSMWYSSNIMCLSVLGQESLDELESIVVELFSPVRCSEVSAPRWPDSPYGPEQLKKHISVVPVKDIRSITLTFPIPDLTNYYRAHPESYISHLIGHEGPGSILTVLRSRGWCNGLVAGPRNDARGFATFSIRMDLTEVGMHHVDDIVALVFQYINLMKKEGPQEEIFNEMRDLKTINFRFKDKEMPLNYVVQLSYSSRIFPMEDVLRAPYRFDDWQPDLVTNEVLNKLTPENLRVTVVAQKFKSDSNLKEHWYGTEYKVEDIPCSTIEKWHNAGLCEQLALPPTNDFIPTDFTVLPVESDVKLYPSIIEDTILSRVWYKQDDKFLMPKASVRIDLMSPLAYLDPLSCNKSVLFVALLEDALNEYVYSALLAGLSYKLMVTTCGLQLYIEGYENKQHVLLAKIIDKMVNLEVNPQRFEILKENHIRSLRNFEKEQPHQHATYYISILMTETVWTKEELLAAAGDLTVEKVQEFIPQLLSNIHLEFLIHGNVTRERALEITNIVESGIKQNINVRPLLPKQLAKSRQIQLEDKCSYLHRLASSVHPSSCTLVYLQCGSLNTENNMKLELFAQILSEPCFNILRTQEQLGYMVFSSMRCSRTEQGLRVIVQSSRDPLYIEKRIEAFLEHMGEYISSMSESEFKRHREALAVRRLVKPKKLQVLTDRFWDEIESQQYHFDRDNVEVAYLRTISKEDLLQYYHELIHHLAPKRRKLSIHVVPSDESGCQFPSAGNYEEGEVPGDLLPVPETITPHTLIEDVLAFQHSHPLCPHPKPYMNIPPVNIGARSKL